MRSHAQFIAVDPRKSHRKDQGVRGLQCQTCFTSFDTSEGLRDHIADFQLEAQQLMKRLLEIQAHLPRKHDNPGNDSCKCNGVSANDLPNSDYQVDDNDWGDSDDDHYSDSDGIYGEDARDDEIGGHVEDRASDRNNFSTLDVHASMLCPYPTCRRKGHFQMRSGLERHYESHVPCYEICVFCEGQQQSKRTL
ncbi:hypothetical protein PISL3812_09923 [Talaromyces islandicus]|uniref:Uncharacterized protein n=1 Tax=Talaromyces islandicus TaxID=28573 RepID=A0A0U1MC01_TALIS|nr:hypothetical protein PISL3812_09923 [Talaromyces islandicus]